MRGRLTTILSLGAAAACGIAAMAGATSIEIDTPLEFSFTTSVKPRALSRSTYTPVKTAVQGKVVEPNGTHPSALREMEVNVAKDIRVNVEGLPICRRTRLTGAGAVGKACGAAVVGRGIIHIEVAFPNELPVEVTSRATAFNGGKSGGKVKLFVQAVNTAPVPGVALIPVTIQPKGSGLHSIVKFPKIAGGSGSLSDFRLELGRTYTHRGKKVGYFEAKCPTGAFNTTVKALFKNEAHVAGVAPTTALAGKLSVPCAPTG